MLNFKFVLDGGVFRRLEKMEQFPCFFYMGLKLSSLIVYKYMATSFRLSLLLRNTQSIFRSSYNCIFEWLTSSKFGLNKVSHYEITIVRARTIKRDLLYHRYIL